MWVIPIRMDPVEIHIHADRRLAFQVLTAFGTAQPDGSASRVLRDEGHRKLVEFHSLIPTAAGGKKIYRTVEWVTLHEPEAIDFEGVEGPLALLRDRFVLEDVALNGNVVRAGQQVIALLGAANRDPEHFDDPERLDVTRADNQHLSLSQGIHYCLGAPLARLESQVAFIALLERYPDLRLAIDSPQWGDNLILRGLKSLPVGV